MRVFVISFTDADLDPELQIHARPNNLIDLFANFSSIA